MEVIPELKNTKSLTVEQQKEKEGELICKSFQPGDVIVLLDEGGKEMRSVEFADYMRERINYLNRYFLTTLHKLYIPNKQIEYAVTMIQRNNGQLSVRQIAEEVYLCERHFERKFKSAVGLSPKTFSNVMRFNYTRQYIKSHKEESLFSTSIACFQKQSECICYAKMGKTN